MVLEVLGEVDRRHAARPEFALEAVAVGEGAGEAGEEVCRDGLTYGIDWKPRVEGRAP